MEQNIVRAWSLKLAADVQSRQAAPHLRLEAGKVSAETFSTVVVIPAWFLAATLWIYSIWCFHRALKHTAFGMESWRAWLWRDDDLSSEGLRFRRRGSRAMLGFVAVVLGVFALAWLLGIPFTSRNP